MSNTVGSKKELGIDSDSDVIRKLIIDYTKDFKEKELKALYIKLSEL